MEFTPTVDQTLYSQTLPENLRGNCVSVRDAYSSRQARIMMKDARVHDDNFAFLSNQLSKLHKETYEPEWYVTWSEDIPADLGGGFVDYVEYFTIDWAGIMSQSKNLVGNGANFIPRVNASMKQNRAFVYTYEVAYDLRFVELEKMKKLTLSKSLESIYNDIIVAGWDLFIQNIAYLGTDQNPHGLFNSDKVLTTAIDNTKATGSFFAGMDNDAVIAFFNGIFTKYLTASNMNIKFMPNRILVPSEVFTDLVNRPSPLMNTNLLEYIIEHSVAKYMGKSGEKLEIVMRDDLSSLNDGKGRIVAYRKDKKFVRIDIPYPIKHFITLPNMERMSYTTAFVGQVSDVQLPYNTSATELGPVTYWDFTK